MEARLTFALKLHKNSQLDGEVGLNLALGLVTSCFVCKIPYWRPECC